MKPAALIKLCGHLILRWVGTFKPSRRLGAPVLPSVNIKIGRKAGREERAWAYFVLRDEHLHSRRRESWSLVPTLSSPVMQDFIRNLLVSMPQQGRSNGPATDTEGFP